MQLVHTFTVPVAIDDAWSALLDFENVAPCLPGARLDRIDGDEMEGGVKVKLGPVLLDYRGVATVTDRDAERRRMSFTGSGRDPRGNSSASATVTAVLAGGSGDEPTNVTVTTDLDVTGRPAQFGRGMMQEVGNRVIGQFAERLAAQLDGRGEAALSPAKNGAQRTRPTAPADPPDTQHLSCQSPPASGPRRLRPTQDLDPNEWAEFNGRSRATSSAPRPMSEHTGDAALDLGAAAGPAVLKRAAPAVGVALGAFVAVAVFRRLRTARRRSLTAQGSTIGVDLESLAKTLQAAVVILPLDGTVGERGNS